MSVHSVPGPWPRPFKNWEKCIVAVGICKVKASGQRQRGGPGPLSLGSQLTAKPPVYLCLFAFDSLILSLL